MSEIDLTFTEYSHQLFPDIIDFAVTSFPRFDRPSNWLIDRWEAVYALGRTLHGLDERTWGRQIGLWLDGMGRIVAIANGEEGKGDGFFQFARPEAVAEAPLGDMLGFLEERVAVQRGEHRYCRLMIPAGCARLERLAVARGYARQGGRDPLSALSVLENLCPRALPEGLALYDGTALRPEAKARAHARAFGYAGDALLEERATQGFGRIATMPHYRPDLDLAVVTRDGALAAFACFWLDLHNALAVLEPLGTVPELRRRGLATGLLAAGCRKAAGLGALRLFVGADTAFYRARGFRVVSWDDAWERTW